jgi:transposase InsO family protein
MSPKTTQPLDAEARSQEIALFRYGLISSLLFDALPAGAVEPVLKEIAAKTYRIPYSSRTKVGISTLRRYLKLYQAGGFEALRPNPRADRRTPRAFPPQVLQKAIALREEQPARTTPMIVELLKRDPELKDVSGLNAHTLTTHLRQHGKTRRLLGVKPRSYKRFEREQPNALWQGDGMVGPWLPDPHAPGKKRRAHLFCFLDDHSRLVPYAEFFFDEALPRLERVLKVGILRRGLPKAIYVDNGKVYAARQFEAACASLGIRKLHTAPYSPEAKGKQERFFSTVRMQFLPEVEASEITTLAELNESFWAWLELIYHQSQHSETQQSPLERFQAGLAEIRSADAETLRKAFLWREFRKVRRDGRIELQGNTYQVPSYLSGRKIELRFDPFDLAHLEIWLDGNSLGKATITQQGREKHVAVEHLADPAPQAQKPKTSFDHLAALRQEYQEKLRQEAGQLQFARLLRSNPSPEPENVEPGS